MKRFDKAYAGLIFFVALAVFSFWGQDGFCDSRDADNVLKLKSVYPSLEELGKKVETTLTGSGFDENTRVSMSLDIGNKMKIIGSIETPGFAWDVAVVGNLAYVTCGNWAWDSNSVWSGLQIIDISIPSKPKKLGSLATPVDANDVEIVGNIAYIACGNSHDERWKGLQIMDVSDPYHPELISSVETVGDAADVIIVGNKAYLANGNNFQVIDITNPLTPEIIGTVETGLFGIAIIEDKPYVSDGSVVGNMAYIADGDIDEHKLSVKRLKIIDVSNPSNPEVIGFTDISGDYIGNVKVIEDIAYVPYAQWEGGGGLQVIDVSNPLEPVTIGSVNTGFSNSLSVIGNMAYLACGDYIYNQWNGLQIIDISNPYNPNLPGNIGIPLNLGNAYDLKIVGNIAYLTSDFDFQIVDVSNPVKPVVIGWTDLSLGGDWIEIYKNRAYIRGWDNIEIIDISNPSNPKNIGLVDIPASGIAFIENIACITSGNELSFIEISNPSNPEYINSVSLPDSAIAIEVDKNIVFIGYGVGNDFHYGGLQLIDASNPSNPRFLGYVDVPVEAAEVKIFGNIVYVAGGMGGFHIIDISDPLYPEIISSVPTQYVAVDFEIVGELAHVIDWEGGLQTIDISNPLSPITIASMDMPGRASGIQVVNNIAYITDWGKGLIIVPVPFQSKSLVINSETNISVTFPEVRIPGHYTLRVFNGKEYDELPGAVTFVPPEESYLLDTKAIIVAGGGPDAPGNIWEETRASADYAYQTLLYQGYTAESIYYLSSDTDSPDVDGDAAYEKLSYALRTWTKQYPPATELLLFFIDHGETGGFFINEKEKLRADELNNWLNELQNALPIPVTFVYDACYSGTFVEQIKQSDNGKERIVLTSTLPNQQAYFLDQGTLTFSYQFWNSVYNGNGIGEAFSQSRMQMEPRQTAMIDANGNGIPNEPEDETLAKGLQVRRGYRPVIDIPYIYGVSDIQNLRDEETSAKLWAGVSYADEDTEIRRVWAIITPPDFAPESSDVPITDLPTVELQNTDNSSVYEGVYDKFTAKGKYAVSIYAMNDKGVYSLPRQTAIIKSADYIDSISEPQVLEGENSARLWAKVKCKDNAITQVKAEITYADKTDELLLEDPDGDCIYENVFNYFNKEGTYIVAVYVLDADGRESSETTTVTYKKTSVKTDEYEDDDTLSGAKVADINSDILQHHNFHDAGDEDWVKILGNSGTTYTFKVSNLSIISDAVIEVYDLDGRTLLTRTEKETFLDWDCPKDGIYYIKLRNLNPDYFGENTKYDFRVYQSTAPPQPGEINGIISDAFSGEMIADARITTDAGGTALSRPSSGAYTVVQEAGNFFMNVEACGYKPIVKEPVSVEEGVTSTRNISLTPADGGAGFSVPGGLCIKAVIHTVEKGAIGAVWKQGGEGNTERGDRVVWGYFYADPNDVSWGSENNPELFVKIWFDADGRIDVNYFHVSVPDIDVYSDYLYDGIAGEKIAATLSRRYIRHYYENGESGSEEQNEDGNPPADDSPKGNPAGSQVISNLRIGAVIHTVEKGMRDAVWKQGGEDITERGDTVVWGHFYADPADVSWGSPNNPDLFVKIWFDVSGRTDVNFFHVSVPDIEVFSDLPADGEYDEKATTAMSKRYIRQEYQGTK